ncbi:HI0074 family nucleotidyltransferase substrate-binding subunit [Candidatus Tisiphia endosymbiont of Hybos culiciformis]|uniref:HI0074 family nucleotidyltransferase substrate-binding subunit n=1 Tax=Candidatus Tisiphia endosymbiont of Hybos culiciformis TaxID=3139331 RepID=UPI003CCA7820
MVYLIDNIDISNLLKAHNKFEEFRLNLDTEQNKAGAIQAFEYCYELAWKTMKRLLEVQGRNAYTPREVFREAAAAGLISDPAAWFDFIKIRNITVHTYDIKNVEQVIATFDDFSGMLHEFLRNLERLNDQS